MASINRVELLGNLGADPVLRHTTNGTAVVTFRVATSRKYTKKDGTVVDETEWHQIVAYGKRAESIAQHKKKGEQVMVEGFNRTRKYTDKGGVDRWTTEVIAENWSLGGVTFIGSGGGGGGRPPHPADDPGVSAPPPDEVPFPDDMPGF